MRLVLLLVVALLTAIAAPGEPANAAVGHVVLNWTSPSYGFAISYRRDSFREVTATSAAGHDRLELASPAGTLTVDASPSDLTPDDCARQAIAGFTAGAGEARVLDEVRDGTGRVSAEIDDGSGARAAVTFRVNCVESGDADFMIRYEHTAASDRFGRYESAARAVQDSYRSEDGGAIQIAPTLVRIDPEVEPPADSNLVNHPTRFFRVIFEFTSDNGGDVLLDQSRIMVPAIGSSLEHRWTGDGIDESADLIAIAGGATVTGTFLFAVPQSQTVVTICIQHITNSDCSLLLDYSFANPGDALESRPLPTFDPNL